MKVVGLITEYNPFHNGHLHHLKMAKEKTDSTHAIAVMSGQFLQRGVPALMNKWKRAQMAVEAGIDLVIELPVIYSTGSAEFFAEGSIAHLDALNIVDSLCFGSEAGNLEELETIARLLVNEPEAYKIVLHKYLNQGHTFPKARSMAISEYLNSETISEIAASPNNILGIEYMKALIKNNSSIKVSTIKRLQAGYHSTELNGDICSATAIRNHLLVSNRDIEELKNFMPETSYNFIEEVKLSGRYSTLNDYYELLRYKIYTMDIDKLKQVKDVTEGLENLIKKAAIKSNTVDDFIDMVKSKRYTQTRIQRILVHILLDIYEDIYPQHIKAKYLRVLAMNDKGKEILAAIRKDCEVPIITTLSKLNTEDKELLDLLDKDIKATDIYNLNGRWKEAKFGLDYRTMPFIK